jgi:hypothetical protein
MQKQMTQELRGILSSPEPALFDHGCVATARAHLVMRPVAVAPLGPDSPVGSVRVERIAPTVASVRV